MNVKWIGDNYWAVVAHSSLACTVADNNTIVVATTKQEALRLMERILTDERRVIDARKVF